MAIRLPAILRTTTFRLAVVNFLLFAAFSVALLVFLYITTVHYIRTEADRQITAELDSLGAAYQAGGFDRLNQSVAERISAPGPYAYYLQGPNGDKITGDFDGLRLPVPLPGVVERVPFTYSLRTRDGTIVERQAEGRAVRLAYGEVLLVAFDWGDRTEVVNRITNVLFVAAPVGLLLSLLGGLIISRSATRRADELIRTTEGVMAGNLDQRAPTNTSGDEFDRLSQRLNAMLDWLQSLVIATRDTGNAIAHDLRTPLTRLRNRLVQALKGPLDEDTAREAISRTLVETDRLLETFSGILKLSQLESGSGAALTRLDASELAVDVAELFEPVCDETGRKFSAEITKGQIVLADRELLAQALSNLLDNAVKYTPEGGTVTLRVKRGRDDDVELSVIDTGPGIAEGDRKRAISRFARLESSRSEAGTGLGLSLVEAIATYLHGKLVLSDGGGPPASPGLAATLYLPRAR